MAYNPQNPNGQATMANSSPVVIASNQTNVPVIANDITATGNITTQNLVPAGTATAGSALLSGTLNGQTTLTVQVTGTYTGALSIQGTVDNTNWVTIGGVPFINVNTGAYSATIASGTAGIFQTDCAGFTQVRITGLAAMTGTAVVTMHASVGAGLVALDASLPAGTAQIGHVILDANSGVDIGKLTANQSVNNAQINGVTPLMGNGVTGTGSQRVTIASDNTPFPVKTDQTTHGTTDLVAADLTKVAGQTAISGGVNGSQAVGGTTAESSAIAAYPLNTGGTAVTAPKTLVHNGDAVGFVADILGRQIILPYTNPENIKQGATSDITNTTATTIIAGTASNYLYVTSILVTNSHATVSTFVNITEETSGTVLYSGYALAAGGGFSVTFPSPMRLPTSGKAIQATCVTTGANVRASAVGFIATI
jgi:hypothetical protein